MNSTTITVAIPDDLFKLLTLEAGRRTIEEKRSVSRSEVVRDAVRDHLKEVVRYVVRDLKESE